MHRENNKDSHDAYSTVLCPFFESSEKELADLKAAVVAFKAKFEGLVAQYGEDPASTDTEGFYSTFHNFAGSFNVSFLMNFETSDSGFALAMFVVVSLTQRARLSAEKDKADEEKRKAKVGDS
jgi:hypothetical protein